MGALCLPSVAAQESPTWILSRLTRVSEELPSTVRTLMGAGYAPVGFEERIGGGAAVLGIRDAPLPEATDWSLRSYQDISEARRSIEELIVQGWIPMDLSVLRGRITILFSMIDMVVTDWTIDASSLQDEAVKRTIDEIESRGMAVWGLSATSDRLYYLAIDEPGRGQRHAVVERVTDQREVINATVSERRAEGYRPWAIAQDPPILYLLFAAGRSPASSSASNR